MRQTGRTAGDGNRKTGHPNLSWRTRRFCRTIDRGWPVHQFRHGRTSTRTIRDLRGPATDKLPIIALTANAFIENIPQTTRAGITGHTAKLLEPDRIDEIMDQWLKNKSRLELIPLFHLISIEPAQTSHALRDDDKQTSRSPSFRAC